MSDTKIERSVLPIHDRHHVGLVTYDVGVTGVETPSDLNLATSSAGQTVSAQAGRLNPRCATKRNNSAGMERVTKRFAVVGTVIALGIGGLYPARAIAQTSPSENWQFGAIVYVYFPSLAGSTSFPGSGSSIDVSADKIISNLKFAFMGAFEAQKGPWGAFTDVIYTNLGGSKSATRDLAIGGAQLPAGITANVSLDIQQWVWTLAGNYRALSTPQASLDVFGGARLLSVKQKLNWSFSGDVGPFVGPGRQGTSQESLDNWDGIVGVKGRLNLGAGPGWFVPYYLDLGTGASHFTWQGIVCIGYAFGWGELRGVWRYLDYDFKSGQTIKSLSLDGPAVGVAFRW